MLTLALAPVLLAQGLWVRARTPRLPEPPGCRQGSIGEGPVLRLLIAGDSAAAGVGAAHQDEALLGRLVTLLAARNSVDFRLEARTGATTASAIAQLESLPAEHYDVAIVSLGVNDVTGNVPLDSWLDRQGRLWELLRDRFAVGRIVACGLPPMHAFPALPQPLRWYLGERATTFDRALQALATTEPNCHYLGLRFSEELDHVAADGFHPGPLAYAGWADRVAALLAET